MQVHDWMTRNVVTVTPETSILNARRLLATYGIRHLPVVDDGRVVGMVSSRDLSCGDRTLNAALATLRSDLAEGRYRPVSSLMSTPARTVSPDVPVQRAAALMLDARIGALPVVDSERLVGLLSLVDCLWAYLASEQEHARRAAQQPCPEDDTDRWMRVPFPPEGDPRPGRSPRPRLGGKADVPGRVVRPEPTGRKAG
jgi:CBS domain-containing protein